MGSYSPIDAAYNKNGITIYHGDALNVLRTLPDESVNCCVTSPPYWSLRDYGVDCQIGREAAPGEYVAKIVAVFQEVRRVLSKTGTVWLNIGDTRSVGRGASQGFDPKDSKRGREKFVCKPNEKPLAGYKQKDIIGIPWMVAFALRDDGWYLRSEIIWSKPNKMPESVRDRCTTSHEYIFMLSKSPRYYFNGKAIAEPCVSTSPPGNKTHKHTYADKIRANGKHSTQAAQSSGRRITDNVARARSAGGSHDNPFGETRNKRSVWSVQTVSYRGSHFAVFPPKLIEPCILASCPEGGTVLDPFFGSGTTGQVSQQLGCKCIGIELNADYIELAKKRFRQPRLQMEAS